MTKLEQQLKEATQSDVPLDRLEEEFLSSDSLRAWELAGIEVCHLRRSTTKELGLLLVLLVVGTLILTAVLGNVAKGGTTGFWINSSLISFAVVLAASLLTVHTLSPTWALVCALSLFLFAFGILPLLIGIGLLVALPRFKRVHRIFPDVPKVAERLQPILDKLQGPEPVQGWHDLTRPVVRFISNATYIVPKRVRLFSNVALFFMPPMGGINGGPVLLIDRDWAAANPALTDDKSGQIYLVGLPKKGKPTKFRVPLSAPLSEEWRKWSLTHAVQQGHWSGRAASVSNSDATGRPRRSVLALGASGV
jgi:hypothetical protein